MDDIGSGSSRQTATFAQHLLLCILSFVCLLHGQGHGDITCTTTGRGTEVRGHSLNITQDLREPSRGHPTDRGEVRKNEWGREWWSDDGTKVGGLGGRMGCGI